MGKSSINGPFSSWGYGGCMEYLCILINIGPQNHPNVVKYTIHGAYGLMILQVIRESLNCCVSIIIIVGIIYPLVISHNYWENPL